MKATGANTSKRLAIAYGVVTGALLVSITLSYDCWSAQHASVRQNEVCLAIWVISGFLLIVSQVAFAVGAGRTSRGRPPTTESPTPPPANAEDKAEAVVLSACVFILLAVAVVIFSLLIMPS